MSELHYFIEQAYTEAKSGNWDRLLAEWREMPLIARRCSRYRKETSGWTFLHQAAFFGQEAACRELIRLGASAGTLSHAGQTAADVAEEKRYTNLAALLRKAIEEHESSWIPSADPDLLPGSKLWSEAVEKRATATMFVAYAGGAVKIPAGVRYYVDSLERVLIGWHGSFDPPCGMDGESMVHHFLDRR